MMHFPGFHAIKAVSFCQASAKFAFARSVLACCGPRVFSRTSKTWRYMASLSSLVCGRDCNGLYTMVGGCLQGSTNWWSMGTVKQKCPLVPCAVKSPSSPSSPSKQPRSRQHQKNKWGLGNWETWMHLQWILRDKLKTHFHCNTWLQIIYIEYKNTYINIYIYAVEMYILYSHHYIIIYHYISLNIIKYH